MGQSPDRRPARRLHSYVRPAIKWPVVNGSAGGRARRLYNTDGPDDGPLCLTRRRPFGPSCFSETGRWPLAVPTDLYFIIVPDMTVLTVDIRRASRSRITDEARSTGRTVRILPLPRTCNRRRCGRCGRCGVSWHPTGSV